MAAEALTKAAVATARITRSKLQIKNWVYEAAEGSGEGVQCEHVLSRLGLSL